MANLKLAVEAINGSVIYPSQTFSFNQAVGPRTPERGYRKGKIYIDGNKVKEYGGGICQIATTLYNAAEEFGLTIAEHHEHNKEAEIPYIEKGEDATIYYGELDLKLKNTNSYAVKLTAEIKNWEVVITITEAS